jgi:hypothetical protein
MTATDDRVHAQLQLLADMRLDDMDPEARRAWQDRIDATRTQYDDARRIEKDDKATAEQKKYAKDLGDSIAKGLPLIVKGLQAAIVAFQKGDAVTGAASVMDILAAAAPIISAMLGATGPQGAVVGAFFTMIGQILSYFAPKQPSLKDQIQKMLQDLRAETQLEGLGAVSLANEVRDRELTAIAHNLAAHTRLSLLVREADQDAFKDAGTLTGRTIIVARGSTAAAGAAARYPRCTIRFIDEIAKDQADPRGDIARTLVASGQADALYGLDVSNRSLRDAGTGLAIADAHRDPKRQSSILELPLLDEDDADDFEKRMKALNIEIFRAQAKSDVATFKTWEVAAWLKSETNQKNAKWPDVLGVWCRTYNDRIASDVKFNCLIDPDLVQKLVRYTHESGGGCPLSKHRRLKIHDLLTDLQGLALDLREESAACNAVAIEVLQSVTEAARKWGLFACLGTNHGLFFTSPANSMAWADRSDTNYYHRIAVLPAFGAGDDGSPHFEVNARYPCFLLKSNSADYPSNHSWLDHLRVRAETLAIEDTRLVRDNPMFFDICGVQRGGTIECWAIPGGRDGIERWTLNKAREFQPVPGSFMAVDRKSLESVRAVYPLLNSLLDDDPDRDAIPPGSAWLDPDAPDYAALVYAGLSASRDIYVNGLKAGHYVPTPWQEYVGIEVDRHLVWVFSHWGFACATHASIIACILQKIPQPRWIQYAIPARLLGTYPWFERGMRMPDREGWAELGNPTDVKGIVSLSPCEDGTLFANIVHRAFGAHANPWSGSWTAFDDPRMYTTNYTIDVARQSIAVSDNWFRVEGGAWKVQKVPIPCWSLMESLKAKLDILQDTA